MADDAGLKSSARIVVAIGDGVRALKTAAVLLEQGFDASVESDLSKFTGVLDESVFAPAPPALVLLGGAPAAVLFFAVETLRREPRTKDARIIVVDEGIGLNERAKLLNAGADDVQTRNLPEPLLAARVRNLLKGAGAVAVKAAAELRLGPIRLDPVSRQAALGRRMLRLTRIQFDLLTALARSQGSAAKASGILEAMAVMGHALDSAGLQSCAVLLNRELVVEGWKLQNSSAGVILSAASFEERLPFLNLALLEALSTILINARIYQEGHQAVSAFSERAVEILSELGRGQAVLIEARQGALTVNGIVPAPGAASPEAVVEFMKSFGIKGFLCEPGLRASDLAGLAKLSKLAALKAAPEDPGAFLRAAGIVSLQLRRERIDDSGESKRLILEYARRMGADRDSACELFGEDAAFILRTRGKERIFEGRAAIRGVLSSYPKDLLFQVTGHGGSGDEFTAVCVVSGGMQALVKDEYKFTVIGGLFARFEASTRLRF